MLHSSRYASGFTVSLVACVCLKTVWCTDSYMLTIGTTYIPYIRATIMLAVVVY